MENGKREPVQFLINTPVEVALEFPEGRLIDTAFGQKTMYSVTGNRVIFAEQELAVKINYMSPAVGECFWINKSQKWAGTGRKKSRVVTWEVSPNRPGIHQPAPNGKPTDIAAAIAATGIEESHLERQLRESKEVRDRAASNIRARLNLEKRGDAPAAATAADVTKPGAAGDSASVPAAPLSVASSAPVGDSTCGSAASPMPLHATQAHPTKQVSDLVESTLALDAPSSAIARKPPTAASNPTPSRFQIEDALKTVMYACKHATAYAREIEYQAPPFTSDDIARMAMTLVIGKEQRR